MKTPNFDNLSKCIEQLIAAHMEQYRNATLATGRAFAVTSGSVKSSSASVLVTPKTRKMAPRRGPEELASLSRKIYEQVCAVPGTTMAALALRMRTPARMLHLPMSELKRDGKVRHDSARRSSRADIAHFRAVCFASTGSGARGAVERKVR